MGKIQIEIYTFVFRNFRGRFQIQKTMHWISNFNFKNRKISREDFQNNKFYCHWHGHWFISVFMSHFNSAHLMILVRCQHLCINRRSGNTIRYNMLNMMLKLMSIPENTMQYTHDRCKTTHSCAHFTCVYTRSVNFPNFTYLFHAWFYVLNLWISLWIIYRHNFHFGKIKFAFKFHTNSVRDGCKTKFDKL